jgi:uncharacterized membrane protein
LTSAWDVQQAPVYRSFYLLAVVARRLGSVSIVERGILMSTSTEAGTPGAVADTARGLRNLYYVRFGFAIVWTGLVALTASALTPVGIALLLIYPLFDVAAAVIDFRSSGAARPRAPLYANMALSSLAAIGLAVAAAAGIVQLIVAILRYRLGGQWAMILSGGISVLAGASFVLQAAGTGAALTNVAGYAALGGVFFLISAIRLHLRAAKVE